MPRSATKAPAISEAQFQQQVMDLAKLHGYRLIYHTHNSRRSAPGFPDLVLVSEHRCRALFRELKTDTGRMSPEQFDWITSMSLAKLDAGVWRPSDLRSGRIVKELRGNA
jgi:hypothetical protein